MQITAYIRNQPLIRITVAYITGILIAAYCSRCIVHLVIPACIVFSGLLGYFFRENRRIGHIFRGSLIYLVFVIAGSYSLLLSQSHNILPDEKTSYTGIVAGTPVVKSKSLQVDCKISSINNRKVFPGHNERVRLYLAPDTLQPFPHVGDSILFFGQLTRIKNSGNPGEFDYARHMVNQGIYYSGFIKKTEYTFGKNSGKMKIRRLATGIQQQLISQFRKYSIQKNELAVLSALTAGNRDYLEPRIRNNYAAVGAMHILAVSGLHVGILYLILTSLFPGRNHNILYRILRTLFILAAIWMYAFITGLSPSVMRAALMFTLFITGKNLNRHVNSYTILAASALIILIINPVELFKVGFQFSYLAVIGIIFFQPRLEQLVLFRNTIAERIWQLFTLSIAAQLSTLPLSLFYFHQFPVYFWLTNMVVIPIVWLIMIATVLFCICIPFGFLLSYIALVLNFLLKILNQSVQLISELPLATITSIRFEAFHLNVAYLSLIALMVLIIRKNYRLLPHLALLLTILLLGANMVSYHTTSKKRELIIYNVRNNALALSIIDGNNHMLVTKGIDNYKENSATGNLRNYWTSRHINRNINWIPFENETPGTIYQGQGIVIQINRDGFVSTFYNTECTYLKTAGITSYSSRSDVKIRILIPGNNSINPGKYLKENTVPDVVLAAISLSYYKKKIWKNFADSYGIEYTDPATDGAYHIQIHRR